MALVRFVLLLPIIVLFESVFISFSFFYYVPNNWERNTEGGREKYIFALKLEFSAPKIFMSDNLFFFNLNEGEFLSSAY